MAFRCALALSFAWLSAAAPLPTPASGQEGVCSAGSSCGAPAEELSMLQVG
eukprot:CAMPEP_0198498688 /NCGR_PEP_ID=MMETSP1462-20131121/7163_1 /TAXON_ID=1333877 /ORGANISM="Brandtodinium nutriculum, Strain RCC3387" /LENGTH=50 /DNA_ID=CAMNT_0044227623 /DNA_START=117 /DNA_END=265 /DNA_ORIENTATION=+